MKISLLVEGQPSELIGALHKLGFGPEQQDSHLQTENLVGISAIELEKMGFISGKGLTVLANGMVAHINDKEGEQAEEKTEEEKTTKPVKERKTRSSRKTATDKEEPAEESYKEWVPDTEDTEDAEDAEEQKTEDAPKPEETEAKAPETSSKKLGLEEVRKVFGSKWQKDSKSVLSLLGQTGHKTLTEFWGEVTDNDARTEFFNALSLI